MDLSGLALVKLLIPKTPLVISSAVLHTLQLSPTSSKWDLRTLLTVQLIRSLTQPKTPTSISQAQAQSMTDPGAKGPMWISKVTASPPSEDDARQLLFGAIDQLKKNEETYTKPEYSPVEAEWTGYRAGVKENAPEPKLSDKEKYSKLMAEVKSPVTILYFHGGAMYLMSAKTHRKTTSRLAQLTGGRAYSVEYRLSPQNPFPAALLDAFVSYLYLLYPPEGSLHDAVPASNIVFAGDSAGGNLAFALLVFLNHLHSNKTAGIPTIKWHGKDVEVPLPAGVSGNSPWLDLTRCLESQHSNAKFDFIPPPALEFKKYPPCPIWPANPPRSDFYCDTLSMAHPLVSPMANTNWSGSPPIFIGCGEELLTDEDKVVAAGAAKQGVPVIWEQHEAMPHCFAMVIDTLPQSKSFFESWAKFCVDAVGRPAELKTTGTWVEAKTFRRTSVNVDSLSQLSDDDVYNKMLKAMRERAEAFKKST